MFHVLSGYRSAARTGSACNNAPADAVTEVGDNYKARGGEFRNHATLDERGDQFTTASRAGSGVISTCRLRSACWAWPSSRRSASASHTVCPTQPIWLHGGVKALRSIRISSIGISDGPDVTKPTAATCTTMTTS